jgi:hypothetical protein
MVDLLKGLQGLQGLQGVFALKYKENMNEHEALQCFTFLHGMEKGT